jgi:hypothetical protein
MDEYIDKCYLVNLYALLHSNKNIQLPKLEKLYTDTKIGVFPLYTQAGLASIKPTMVGRPSTRRYKSSGEGGGEKVRKAHQCENCDGVGHNASKCRQPVGVNYKNIDNLVETGSFTGCFRYRTYLRLSFPWVIYLKTAIVFSYKFQQKLQHHN